MSTSFAIGKCQIIFIRLRFQLKWYQRYIDSQPTQWIYWANAYIPIFHSHKHTVYRFDALDALYSCDGVLLFGALYNTCSNSSMSVYLHTIRIYQHTFIWLNVKIIITKIQNKWLFVELYHWMTIHSGKYLLRKRNHNHSKRLNHCEVWIASNYFKFLQSLSIHKKFVVL